MLIIFFLQSVGLAELSKRKPEIQVSHECLQRTLCKDLNDSLKWPGIFNET